MRRLGIPFVCSLYSTPQPAMRRIGNKADFLNVFKNFVKLEANFLTKKELDLRGLFHSDRKKVSRKLTVDSFPIQAGLDKSNEIAF